MSDKYNFETIRKLVNAAFNPSDIKTLAFDRFPEVNEEFTPGMPKSQMIELLLDSVRRQGQVALLLVEIKQRNSHQYGRFANQLLKTETIPVRSPQQTGWQQRKVDLERHISEDLQLLADYENALRNEDEPRRKNKYLKEIERQKQSLVNYRQQLETFEQEVVKSDAVTNQHLLDELKSLKQTITSQHRDVKENLDGMEDRLATGQQAILRHIDQKHQQTINAVLSRLDENQLELVSMMLTAVDNEKILREEAADLLNQTTEILEQLKAQPNGDEWQRLLAAVEEPVSLEQKLKVMLPIIPGILEYETEFAVDGIGWLKDSWHYITNRIRRNRS